MSHPNTTYEPSNTHQEDNTDSDTTNMSLSYDYWREREDEEQERAEDRYESYSSAGYDR